MPGQGGARLSDDDKPEGEVVRVDFGARRAKVPTPVDEDPPAAPHDQEKLAVFTRMIDRGLVMVTLDASVNASSPSSASSARADAS